MGGTSKERVYELLEVGLAERGLSDARSAFRALLRDLKVQDTASFERASGYYSGTVVPTIAGGADAVETWIEYGRFIGQLRETGDLMSIDVTGRARRYVAPLKASELVLFIADGGRSGAFVVVSPVELSPAQSATSDLLVEGKLSLQ